MSNNIIFLKSPAKKWDLSYPVGNGRIGASVCGKTDIETIYLNEESIWSSSEHKLASEGFRDKIDIARQLILEGRLDETDDFINKALVEFDRVDSYEYAGILNVRFDASKHIENYSRKLDLLNGISYCNYSSDGIAFSTLCFVPKKQDIIVYNINTDKDSSYCIGFDRENTEKVQISGNVMIAECTTAKGNHHFCISYKVFTNGKTNISSNGISIKDASNTTVVVAVRTEFRTKDYISSCCNDINYSTFDLDKILSEHKKEFSAIMGRSQINLVDEKSQSDADTSERLKRLKLIRGSDDFELMATYWQFGKYLLVSSSRPGSLPANLQGIWVEGLQNPWNSDFHTNINLQMNYWQAEGANISDCTIPLFDYMNNYLLESGKKTAKDYYRVEGTVVHHLSDIYGFTVPADGVWGLWPMGAAWLSYHMWEHYLYTNDKDFLRNSAYEYIKQSALFFMNFMFKGKDGKYHTGPSTSPENSYFFNGKEVDLTISPTMDIEIVSGLLSFYIECEDILNIDKATRTRAEEILSKMPGLKVGKYGQLMEWIEDYEETEPGHRHISHAFGLYPGNMITRQTPDLYKAIEVSIDRRLSNGGGHTGWSRAWLINLFARLRNGEEAYHNFKKLLTKSTNDNLFDMHPPFQIDGNFGGAAGLTEMLVQSHEGFISLLPAVTDKFTGNFKGIKARGNIEISSSFESGHLTEFSLKSANDQLVFVEFPQSDKSAIYNDENELMPKEDGLFAINLKAGIETSYKIF